MRSRPLGRSGLQLSELTLGTWLWGGRTPPEEALAIGRAYLGAGGTTIDTAHGYAAGASEELVGRLLGEVGREEVVVCTKAGLAPGRADTSRRGLTRQLTESLGRLGTDHVDLWLVHVWSDDVPLEETLATLRWALDAGLARYVGVSNYEAWQLARAATLAEAAGWRLVADQVEWSLLERGPEDGLAAAGAALGVGIMAYSPLAGGTLTGKYRHGTPADSRLAVPGWAERTAHQRSEHGRAVVEALTTAARGLETTPTALALAWVLARQGVSTAVVGPRTEGQLRASLEATGTELPEQIAAALDEVSSAGR